ncbi:hypothetical protein MUK42_35521 [Musa troglodytarum]|uniref:Uncharacterized protein n=1 Tax=Musa troglodytarum TaxID=320322 RepID=A0A9E7HIN0_9LILI|nr:hypothetical protein MUK42_35521 [Musa troglodytarum]
MQAATVVDIPCDQTPATIKGTAPWRLEFEEVIFEWLQALNGDRPSMAFVATALSVGILNGLTYDSGRILFRTALGLGLVLQVHEEEREIQPVSCGSRGTKPVVTDAGTSQVKNWRMEI